MNTTFNSVSSAAIEYYQNKGVVCLRGMIDEEWLEWCREGVRKSVASPGRFFRDYSQEGSAGRYTFEYWNWEPIPEFKHLIFDSSIGEFTAKLLGAKRLNLIMDQWFRREAGSTNAASWHQDEPYFDFFEGQKCVVWFPLEAASAAEGLTFIAGSHRWGKLFMAQNFGKREPFDGDMSGYEPTQDFEDYRHAYLSWDMQIGDCLVFDFRTLHRATSDLEALPRTGHRMSYRYGDQDVLFQPRGHWTEEISQYLIERGQRVGEAINCDLMPVVYPK